MDILVGDKYAILKLPIRDYTKKDEIGNVEVLLELFLRSKLN